MQVVQNLKGFCVSLLGKFDGSSFREPFILLLSVGQVAFPGRTLSDAANYLFVVLVAVGFGTARRAPWSSG
jgi:hypothetical protein